MTLRWCFIAIALLGCVTAVRVAAWPLAPIASGPRYERPRGIQTPDSIQRPASESLTAIVARDPFRIGRKPATTTYDPLRVAEQLRPPPPKPLLLLAGVVNGLEPAAIVEGLPGVEGSRVLRVGDVVSGLRVKQISNGRIVIVGMDTTWVLEVREPWR